MIPLLLLVVLIAIATNIISTVGAPAINALLWNIYTRLFPSPVSATLPEAARVRDEVFRLRKELTSTSSQDEFARWAKVRRTLDKKVVELEGLNATISTYRASFDSRASSIRWVLTKGLNMFLQLWFARRPIFWVPEGWVPGVVEWGLAFPRAPRGSVSIQVWSFAVGQTAAVVVALAAWGWGKVLRRRKVARMLAAERVAAQEAKKE